MTQRTVTYRGYRIEPRSDDNFSVRYPSGGYWREPIASRAAAKRLIDCEIAEGSAPAATPETRVIIRIWRNDETTVCILPDCVTRNGDVTTYSPVDGHGEAAYSALMRATRPADFHETERGLSILRRLPYPYENLRVIKRR